MKKDKEDWRVSCEDLARILGGEPKFFQNLRKDDVRNDTRKGSCRRMFKCANGRGIAAKIYCLIMVKINYSAIPIGEWQTPCTNCPYYKMISGMIKESKEITALKRPEEF